MKPREAFLLVFATLVVGGIILLPWVLLMWVGSSCP
jgi:hypothetical protein